MAKFTFTPLSTKRLSRKAILGIAAALAVTGATGAAALLAPGNISQILPAVSAQTVGSTPTDVAANEPFDRVERTPTIPPGEAAPAGAPEVTQQSAPTRTAAAPQATETTPPDTAARQFDRPISRAPATAPTRQSTGPAAPRNVAQAPAAEAPTAAPEGRMIPTAAPGVISTKQRVAQTKIVAPVKQIVRPRAVYIPVEICID